MYRVILVDDEIWSLEGICKMLDWESMGFTVTALSSDSLEALDLICRTKPDVVFTDIRMPEISGIELLKMSRQAGVISEFIIISGYAEFEYAQEALRQGAFDYRLKPFGKDEGMELLGRLKLHLEQKRIADDLEIFEELICSLNNPYEFLRKADFLPDGKLWRVVIISGESTMDSGMLSSQFKDMNHLTLRLGIDKFMIILNGDVEVQDKAESMMKSFDIGNNFSIGLSTITEDVSDLSRLIREADMAACSSFIGKESSITQFNPCFSAGIESIPRKLERLVGEKNFDEISSTVDSIPSLFARENLGMYHVANLWNHLSSILRLRSENDLLMSKFEFLNYMELYNRFGNLTSLCEHVKVMFEDICCTPNISSSRQKNINENFMALIEFVNENYNKKLSLSELAERYFLNMSYCSDLFKKVTGYTFSDYVTKLRMERAVELLQEGVYSVDKVSVMTGYNDYYYFCKTFKKFHGSSVSQFTAKSRFD